MNFEFFIGIDVSKSELDFAVMQGRNLLFHQEIVNTPESIASFISDLKKVKGFKLDKAVFCMEHTGIYTAHLLSGLHKRKQTFAWNPPPKSAILWVISEVKMIRLMRSELPNTQLKIIST